MIQSFLILFLLKKVMKTLHYIVLILVFVSNVCHALGDVRSTNSEKRLKNSVKYTFNSCEYYIDTLSGCFTGIKNPNGTWVLSQKPENASMINVALPLAIFEPFRMGSTGTKNVIINEYEDSLVLSWNNLNGSRDFETEGNILTKVTIIEADDNLSVIMKAKISNNTDSIVPQIVFPDLKGIPAFNGKEEMRFRNLWNAKNPWKELEHFPEYAHESIECVFKGHESKSRWYDIGGYRDGISIYERKWGFEPFTKGMVSMDYATENIRFMGIHYPRLKPGETWESGEFYITPHAGGWAKGIIAYKKWVDKNFHRAYKMPEHIREGLGFRTVFMSHGYPHDPQDAVFTFNELPELIEETKAHGLVELVPWMWHFHFTVPLSPPFEHLGGEKKLFDAIQYGKEKDTRISLFLSIATLKPGHEKKYNFVTDFNRDWSRHPEFIPFSRPPYGKALRGGMVDIHDFDYQREVKETISSYIEKGASSICWDQFFSGKKQPNLQTLAKEIRAMAVKDDPHASFSGEELWNHEVCCDVLDYTWNWSLPKKKNIQPFTSVFSAPRRNANVTNHPEDVKLYFADNLFINVMPYSDTNRVVGSDWIHEHPNLSKALNICSQLRKQFLSYFTEGMFIGDCMLTESSNELHLAGYVKNNAILIIILNKVDENSFKVPVDIVQWISKKDGFIIKQYNEAGKTIYSGNKEKLQNLSFTLHKNELTIFEVSGYNK